MPSRRRFYRVQSGDDTTSLVLALDEAVRAHRSDAYCLMLWSRLVRRRDGNRCVVCSGIRRLQAHHVLRKSALNMARYQPGNGISLCEDCHREPHRVFNRRPDLALPYGAEGGDDLDLATAYFETLFLEGKRIGHDLDVLYWLSDEVLSTLARFQGLEGDFEVEGPRIWRAFMILRQTPRSMLRAVMEANGFVVPQGLVQQGDLHLMLQYDTEE